MSGDRAPNDKHLPSFSVSSRILNVSSVFASLSMPIASLFALISSLNEVVIATRPDTFSCSTSAAIFVLKPVQGKLINTNDKSIVIT
jgi:hypothetical protein